MTKTKFVCMPHWNGWETVQATVWWARMPGKYGHGSVAVISRLHRECFGVDNVIFSDIINSQHSPQLHRLTPTIVCIVLKLFRTTNAVHLIYAFEASVVAFTCSIWFSQTFMSICSNFITFSHLVSGMCFMLGNQYGSRFCGCATQTKINVLIKNEGICWFETKLSNNEWFRFTNESDFGRTKLSAKVSVD